MFGGQKVTQLIEFPIANLDLSKYIMGALAGPGGGQYELYGVSNHYGGLDGGHYTADCRSPVNGKWYSFDDSRVSEKRGTAYDLVSDAAYVLFYRRVK